MYRVKHDVRPRCRAIQWDPLPNPHSGLFAHLCAFAKFRISDSMSSTLENERASRNVSPGHSLFAYNLKRVCNIRFATLFVIGAVHWSCRTLPRNNIWPYSITHTAGYPNVYNLIIMRLCFATFRCCGEKTTSIASLVWPYVKSFINYAV